MQPAAELEMANDVAGTVADPVEDACPEKDFDSAAQLHMYRLYGHVISNVVRLALVFFCSGQNGLDSLDNQD